MDIHTSLIDSIADKDLWERFYEHKISHFYSGKPASYLRDFIDSEGYLSVLELIKKGSYPLPSRTVISKMSTQKKRTVYTYPYDFNLVMKFLTYNILRKYDRIFTPNLYSFRPSRIPKDAIRFLTHIRGIGSMYAYKVDISNYFNSIPVERLLPMIDDVLSDDPPLCEFLKSLLLEPRVLDKGEVITESKGIMAGTPIASFYADLYLRELDAYFYKSRVPYVRYSDDIILFAKTEAEVTELACYVRSFLEDMGLSVNPAKESFYSPADGWVFLGFSYRAGVIDIASASVDKIKAKMRRKTRALKRWAKRRDASPDRAARAFVRVFNRKLFEKRDDNDLTWSLWYFPVINTTSSLEVIDHYAQDCLRYLASGKRTKARFNVSYGELKELGYKSLVNEYYRSCE